MNHNVYWYLGENSLKFAKICTQSKAVDAVGELLRYAFPLGFLGLTPVSS